MESLHRPRRVLIALLIASTALGGVLAVGGQAPGSDLPDAFSTPLPTAGDEGRYDMVLLRDGPGGAEVVAALPYLRFRVEPVGVLDGRGTGHAALELSYAQAGYNRLDDGYGWGWAWDQHLRLTPSGRELSLDWVRDGTFPGQDLLGTAPDARGPLRMLFYRDLDDGTGAGVAHCLLQNALQGVPAALDALPLFGECGWSWNNVSPDRPLLRGLTEEQVGALGTGGWGESVDEPFSPVAVARLDGHDALVLRDSNGTEAWFRADVPYPVRVEVPPGADGLRRVFLLTYDNLPAAPATAPPDAPDLVQRPVRDWGPDATGWTRYGPAEAWATASSDERVQAFLEDNPDARMARAGWSTWTEDPTRGDDRLETTETWAWEFQAGDQLLTVSSTVDAGPRVDPEDPSAVVESLARTPRVEVEQEAAPNAMPPEHATLPTLTSTVARFLAFTGADPAEVRGVHYNLRASDVSPAEVIVSAYVDDRQTTPDAESGLHRSRTVRYSNLYMEMLGGDATYLSEAHLEGAQGLLAAGPAPAPREPLSAVTVDDDWSFPPLVVAGAGLLALLAAAAYYFHPVLKSAAVGLFSRVRPDELLAHPLRRDLHDLVASEPGIHVKEVQRRLGTAVGATEHHLRKLLDGGRLLAHEAGGYRCLYVARTDRRLLPAGPALRHDSARAVLAAVLAEPGTHAGALAERLGLGRATVVHHVQRLAEAGLVSQVRDGNRVRLHPTPVADLARRAGMAA